MSKGKAGSRDDFETEIRLVYKHRGRRRGLLATLLVLLGFVKE